MRPLDLKLRLARELRAMIADSPIGAASEDGSVWVSGTRLYQRVARGDVASLHLAGVLVPSWTDTSLTPFSEHSYRIIPAELDAYEAAAYLALEAIDDTYEGRAQGRHLDDIGRAMVNMLRNKGEGDGEYRRRIRKALGK